MELICVHAVLVKCWKMADRLNSILLKWPEGRAVGGGTKETRLRRNERRMIDEARSLSVSGVRAVIVPK